MHGQPFGQTPANPLDPLDEHAASMHCSGRGVGDREGTRVARSSVSRASAGEGVDLGMERAIAERARIGEDRSLDVHHRESTGDPQGTIRKIYDWLDLEFTPRRRTDHFRLAKAEPHGRPGYAPLHSRAVRTDNRSDPIRLRLLHPPFDIYVEG
jgi:hypothetical protein